MKRTSASLYCSPREVQRLFGGDLATRIAGSARLDDRRLFLSLALHRSDRRERQDQVDDDDGRRSERPDKGFLETHSVTSDRFPPQCFEPYSIPRRECTHLTAAKDAELLDKAVAPINPSARRDWLPGSIPFQPGRVRR